MKIFTSCLKDGKNKFSFSFFTAFLLLLGGMANAQSNHTVTFTGSAADFNTAEKFSAAANSTDYYITFDATYMYFGAFRTSGTFGSGDNFSIYLDTDPRNTLTSGNGTTAGRAYNGFTPTLPFNADYTSITEQSYTDPINRYNGSWASISVTPTVFTSSTCREVRIALSDLGNPASVYATVWMGYSGGIFSNAPGTSNEGTAATRTMTGFFGSFPVYKTGVTPVSFRTQNTSAANGGGTAISNLSVTAGNTITAGDYGDITISNAAATSPLGGNTSFTGTFTIGSGATPATKVNLSTFTLTVGGRGIGGTAGQISVNGSSGAPFTTGTGGAITFLGNGLFSGANTQASLILIPSGATLSTGGQLDIGAIGGATLKSGMAGILQINPNGSIITNPVNYQSGSSLIYNTGSTYGAGLEWTANSTTLCPSIVTLQNNTAVNFGASTTYRQANGLLTIGSGSSLTLSTVAGGDLRIAGGLTNNNTGAGVGLTTGGRALFVQGSGTYTKAGADNIDFLIFGSASTLTLATGTNLSLTNTGVTGCLQFNATSTLAMAGTNTVTVVAGGTVAGTAGGSITGTSPINSILSLAGTTTWSTGAAVTSSVNVGIQVNSGLTISTAGRLSAGYLQINPGGFIGGTNPVVYPASGTLVYNHNSGTYGVQALEWPATSGPVNVTVNNNGSSTGISFANNNITARTLTGTLTLNHDIDLSGSGTPNLTTLNTIANATATVKGIGNFTHTASGSLTTANTAGVNGTLTTSGTKTLPATTNFIFNNATSSQVTGTLMPTTINNLTINNPTAATGTTISSNTLVISGTTTLTAGALVLPTGAGNLVTMTGIMSAPAGTITGSATSNLVTSATPSTNIAFTSGAASLNNWTVNTTFGTSAPLGLSSVVTINGTFLLSGLPDIYTTSTGGLIIASGATYNDGGKNANRFMGAGSFNLQSGSNIITGNTSGLTATTAAGAVQTTGTRTYSGSANYTFNNSVASAQTIGDALDGAGGTGKTGPITGAVVLNNNTGAGITLNAGTTITINTPGTLSIGSATSAGIVTASATSVIDGTGAVIMLGNGATSGSTLVTAHANGVSGTIQTSGSNSLTNGANNNTNFTFNGSVAQTTGSLLPATVNNLNFSNTFSGAVATPSVTLSSSVTTSGTITFAGGAQPLGVVSIGAGNTLTINGALTLSNANKLIGTSTSNLAIGGTGSITGSGLFLSGGGALNNFTFNRSGQTILSGTALTVSGTFTNTAGVLSLGAGLTLNGPIAFGAGTITGGTNPLTIGGSGAITGTILSTSTPLVLSGITMNRSGATLTLGTNVTVSNTTGLTLTAGNIALGSFNLTSTNTGGSLGSGSTSSMVVATGTGQAICSLPTTGFVSQTYPIGDGTNYTPVTFTFSATASTGTVGARLTASTHPSINTGSTPAVSISRYWTFTCNILTYTYTASFRYISPGDVTGPETSLKLSRWNGTAWTEYAGSSVSSPIISSGTLSNTTGPLNSTNDYTGRGNSTVIDYVWSGTTNDWNTAGNWTPNGVPSSVDNVTIDGSLSSVLCSINSGSSSVNNFILNGTGTFAMASGSSLSIGNAITFGGSATASLDCASTLNMTSTSSQTVPALNYGNLNLTGGARVLASSGSIGVCGTFTPGAGGFTTTGSTIDFNGSGTQTIPVFNYANLTSSSTGGRTLASGTVGVDGVFTPGTNSYTITGNTINFSNASSQTIPAFNYNAITNSGNGARTLASSGTVGIAGNFTPGSGAYTVTGSTVDYNGTAGFTMSTFTYNNLIISGNKGAGTVSFGTGTVTIGGSLSYTATNSTQAAGTGTVAFNSAGSQTIPALNYFNLTASGGARTLDSTGTINIAGTVFTPGSGPYTVTGSTVNFNGSTGFAIPALTPAATNNYNNLTISGSGTYSQAASLTVGNDYNQSAGTFSVTAITTSNNLTVAGNFGMTGGTFNVLNNTSPTTASTVTVTGNTTTSGTASINLEPLNNANANGIGIFQTKDFTTTSTSGSIVNFGATTVTNNEFRVSGNFSKSGTGTFNTSSTTTSNGFIFNKTGVQTFSYAGNDSQYTQYVVNSGSTLQMLTGLVMGSGTNPLSKFTVNGTLDVNTFVISGTTNPTFTLNAGGTLITANATGVTGSITTPGTNTYNAGANYVFDGTVAQTTNIPNTTINNITINNSAANVKINQSTTVNGNLTFTSGNLDLNGSFNITLGTAANIVTETNTARLINSGSPTAANGYIGTTRTLGANPGNVGNIGMNISVGSAMGSTVIKRFPKAVTSIPTSLTSISRVYSILPASASVGSTITLSYFDGELGSNTETAPSLVTFNSTGANETVGSGYSYIGASATNATANTVTYNVANLTTTNTFWTCLNSVKYITNANGDWNTTGTWIGSVVPPANADVIINHTVTIGADSASINSLTINSGKSLTVNSGFDLTVKDAIINNGTLTVENTANLVQVNDVANSGSGSTVVNRNSSAIKRLDYTLWCSPVAGAGLYAFSKFTLPNRFYVYLPLTNAFSNSVGFSLTGLQYPSPLVSPNGVNGTDSANVLFATGKGYLIRVPYDHPTTETPWNGSFSGTLANNGDIPVAVSLAGEPVIGYGYNAVGNPYPSRLSVRDFIDGNTNITGTLYFWRKSNSSSDSSYATLTKTAYVANGARGGDTGTGFFNTGNESNWVLNVGQGFFVQATSGSAINFTNTMRRSSNSNQFFKSASTTNDVTSQGLYWLNLNTVDNVENIYSQMAVGYSSEATLDVDRGIDGANINRDFYLTSLIGTGEYSVQGRPEFQDSDIVPLSCKILTAGNYTITIDHTAGLFSGGTQSIYLKDKLTDTVTDLSAGAYAFTSEAGTFTNRFEVIYQSQLGVHNPAFTENNVLIYSHNNEFVVTTGTIIMSSIKVFDIRGRLIEEKKGINASQTTINGGLADGVLLIQITSEDGAVVTKKVVK